MSRLENRLLRWLRLRAFRRLPSRHGFLSVSLVNDGPNGHTARVFLDGHEITHGVRSVQLRMAVGEPNGLTLEVFTDQVEVDVEIRNALALYGKVVP